MLEAEKNPLGKNCCRLALAPSVPVAGHVCLDRGLATHSPLVLQVHAEAQVAERKRGGGTKRQKTPGIKRSLFGAPQRQGRCCPVQPLAPLSLSPLSGPSGSSAVGEGR